ncbi:MAG: hypothetical protein U5K56_14465 [Halioglobus sp.]|nr:hypothetical protein [Halioglobus sp.]
MTFAAGGLFHTLDPLEDDYTVQLPGTFELIGGGLSQPDAHRSCLEIGGADSALYPVPADLVYFREVLTGTELFAVAGNTAFDPDEEVTYCAYKSQRGATGE